MAAHAPPNLQSTFEEIMRDLRFRVLTVGRSGAGKTSLIKRTFKIPSIQMSHQERGVCEIDDELQSDDNKFFVLHDSQGFEAGETENLEKVKEFLSKRMSKDLEIKDRLHAIWLCIQIPEAGGRVIERGEEKLFQTICDPTFADVPVIIVFTQYDNLYNYIHFKLASDASFRSLDDHDAQHKRIDTEARRYFQRECVDKLKPLGGERKVNWVAVSTEQKYSDTLTKLTQETEKLIKPYVAEKVWVAAATAQRVNVEQKIDTSVVVGFRKYWKDLASGANFAGIRLNDCIGVIHLDIVSVWNFFDSAELLASSDFKARILKHVQDLADPNPSSADRNTGFSENLGTIKAALDVAAPFGGPVAPIISTIGLTMVFTQWLFGFYATTPETVRVVMAYIVDLTIVLEGLFWITSAQPTARQLEEDDIIASFNLYSESEQSRKVHEEIRNYVNQMNFAAVLSPDVSHVKVKELIMAYRRNFIEETNLKNPSVALQLSVESEGAARAENNSGGRSTPPPRNDAQGPTSSQSTHAPKQSKTGRFFKRLIGGKKS